MDSPKNFDVFMPTRIIFGSGRVSEIGKEAGIYGKRAMLVTYKDIRGMEETIERVSGYLNEAGLSVTRYSEIEPDPSVEIIDKGAEIVKDKKIEMIIGLGGGSAIDASKAIGVVAINGGSAWDYVACNPDRKLFSSSMPILAIPTTSGTGSEVTLVAVITNRKVKSKSSIAGAANLPKIAIVDPELAKSMPPGLTATTGVDAFGHALEAYVSLKCTPFVEIISPEAIKLIWDNLPIAYKDGDNMVARANMAWASTLAGAMLVQAGAIGNHSLAQALGAHLRVPHGLGVAVGTPHFIEFTRAESKDKYIHIAHKLGIAQGIDDEEKIIDEFISQVKKFLKNLDIPDNLKDWKHPFDKNELLENAMINAPGALSGTPRSVTRKDMENIISKIVR